ncbi:hypothetical protein [Aureliella helgolandensis]|uniref:Uncharacterized protein n=1 Tax=Aureliella helgolandensis TaxID=2527968 RepID=A0A518GGS0_9BACT|nr:hypothetical protein [Aureliella helgolandensis]QDV27784.1 hypothetical protein Q31a_61770 [Aureliella helgolandensis]
MTRNKSIEDRLKQLRPEPIAFRADEIRAIQQSRVKEPSTVQASVRLLPNPQNRPWLLPAVSIGSFAAGILFTIFAFSLQEPKASVAVHDATSMPKVAVPTVAQEPPASTKKSAPTMLAKERGLDTGMALSQGIPFDHPGSQHTLSVRDSFIAAANRKPHTTNPLALKPDPPKRLAPRPPTEIITSRSSNLLQEFLEWDSRSTL